MRRRKIVVYVMSLLLAMSSILVPLTALTPPASAHGGSDHHEAASVDVIARAEAPASGNITVPPPASPMTRTVVSFAGGPYTVAVLDRSACTSATCDYTAMHLTIPAAYWDSHVGGVTVTIDGNSEASDFDLFVYDDGGNTLKSSTSTTGHEEVDLGMLAPGDYTVEVMPFLPAPNPIGDGFSGEVVLQAQELTGGLVYPREDITTYLTVSYPLYVVFMGREPSAADVAELRANIPTEFRPAIAQESPGGDEVQQTGAGLVNWQKDHLLTSQPTFMPYKFEYDLHILHACDCYSKDLYAEINAHTKFDYPNPYQDFLSAYNSQANQYRVLEGAQYAVSDVTTYDLIDALAIEDWIFNTRFDQKYQCAFTDLETGACYDPSFINPDPNAYHDPYYDLNPGGTPGVLNMDKMPQGPNAGSTLFLMDTFTPDWADAYFRPNKYHSWGTRQIDDHEFVTSTIDPYSGQTVSQPNGERITDPDSGQEDGIDWARTWGGRYRFHFVDLGAMPNDIESESWANRGRSGGSAEAPYGDPPIWEYEHNPAWNGTNPECTGTDPTSGVVIDTRCAFIPRMARDVDYSLFFRMTAAYLYRPLPEGDVIWLDVKNYVDYYSRPIFTDPDGGGPLPGTWNAGTPPFEHSPWWTDTTILNKPDNVLRWLGSALPHVAWIGHPAETYTVQRVSDGQIVNQNFGPTYDDLPAPPFHTVFSTATLGISFPAEPTYDPMAPATLVKVQAALEKGKAQGLSGTAPDFSVSHESFRDFVDANRDTYAPNFKNIQTIPAFNVVFEKVYTWALPAIVGGIAVAGSDGQAWGVLQNVNDRFKWDQANRPTGDINDPNQRQSLPVPPLPTQATGTGFSYTIEHEAAHNLGLSHPHDGSYGVDKCPAGHPNEGEWKCYWTGLGWMYDSAAAPTTYAMSYRPYEVEDQDGLMRGRAAEYLVRGQDKMVALYVAASAAGLTEPTADMLDRDADMKAWRQIAATLFRNGDYLHAEYAARNAYLATQDDMGVRLAQGPTDVDPNRVQPRKMTPGETPKPYVVNPQTVYTAHAVPAEARADVNRDGIVDIRDVQLVAGIWMTTCDDPRYVIRYDNVGDLNLIEIDDIIFVAERWLTTFP